MLPGYMSESAANAHRDELLREARKAALVAEATAKTGGFWTAALLLVADLLVNAGQRLRARLARGQVAHARGTLRHADGLCQSGAACRRVVWLDV